MTRQIAKILLGILLLAHAAGFAIAASQPPVRQILVLINASQDAREVITPLAADDDQSGSGRVAQHLPSCHDQCTWSAEQAPWPIVRFATAHSPTLPDPLRSEPRSVALPPPR